MKPNDGESKRVVVYRLGSMGDTLVALPAFHLVRRAFPGAHITLLTNVPVNEKAAPMAAMLANTNLYNDVVSYPNSLRDIGRLRQLRATLRAGRHDCLVYLTEPKGGIASSLRDYVFFRLCGIRRVVGVPFRRRTLRPVPIEGSELFMSETARVLECIQSLGTVDVNAPEWWDLMLMPEEIAEGARVLRERGIDDRYIAASIGTKIQANDWEEANWSSLLERLAGSFTRIPLVLFGTSDERERSERLVSRWNGPKANLCGVTSPRVSAAALREALLMLSHDSGPMHLAATMNVPCVAIFSARNPPGVWYPRGEQHSVLYRRTPCWGCKLTVCVEHRKACILSISVDDVESAVRAQLARHGISPA